jgi:hypothetical protein
MSKKLVSLSLVISGLAACGSGSKEMTVAQFTNDISEIECERVTMACLVTQTDCLATRQVHWSDVASQQAATGRPFDPDMGKQCLSKTKSVYGALEKGMAISAEDYRDFLRTCARIFHGPANLNEKCAADLDCTGSLVCDIPKQRCGNRIEVGPGKGCANVGESCSQGFTCLLSDGVYMCVAKASKGTPCTSDESCLEALRCAGGVCADGLGVGYACQADENCATGFCEPYALKCGADIRFAPGSPACQAFQSAAPVVPVSSPDASVVD